MVVRVDFTTYGGDVSKFYQEEFRYLGAAISEFISENKIRSSIEYLEIKFYFYQEIDSEEKRVLQERWLSSLPRVRLLKNKTSLHLEKHFVGIDKERREFLPSFDDVLHELTEALKIISKKKKDVLEIEKLIDLLPLFFDEYRKNWRRIRDHYKQKRIQEAIKKANEDRESRRNADIEKTRLIYDLRFYPEFENYDHRNSFMASFGEKICLEILRELRNMKFRLPKYDHIYIKASDHIDRALSGCVRTDTWYVWGIAILEDIQLFLSKNENDQKKVIFELIQQGMYDVAEIDRLDTNVLKEVFDKVESRYLNE